MTSPRIEALHGAEIGPTVARLEAAFPVAHCLATPRWLPVLDAAYGVKTVVFLAAGNDDAVAGYLPAYFSDWSRSLFGLRHGLQARDAATAEALVAAARRFAAAEGLAALDLGIEAGVRLESAHVVQAAGFAFDLSGCRSDADLRALLSSHGRRALKNAQRCGQELRASPAEFGPAAAVYEQAMRQRGVRVHERVFLQQIAGAFGDGFVPLVCYHEGEAVAATFLLIHGPSGAYLYGGTSARGMKLQSGSLLYFEMMRRCLAQGAEVFDPGESSPGSGTYEFKRRIGASPRRLCYLREALAPSAGSGAAAGPRRRLAAAGARALLKAGHLFGRQLPLRAALLGRRII